MRETGNVFAARGVLEAAHVLGHGCDEGQSGSARNFALCGSGGGASAGANLASLGVGTARVAMGLALVAIADATTPAPGVPRNALGMGQAVAQAPGALDRYEDPRRQHPLLSPELACIDRLACPRSLDPRRVIPVAVRDVTLETDRAPDVHAPQR
jgi:hypothetical protein